MTQKTGLKIWKEEATLVTEAWGEHNIKIYFRKIVFKDVDRIWDKNS
jgi:hypothetical protein